MLYNIKCRHCGYELPDHYNDGMIRQSCPEGYECDERDLQKHLQEAEAKGVLPEEAWQNFLQDLREAL